MPPTVARWIAASRPEPRRLLAALALVALGHYAVLASLWWDRQDGGVFPLAMTAPNLLVLAATALARRPIAWRRGLPALAIVGASAVLATLEYAARSVPRGADRGAGELLLSAVCGAFLGAFGAAVAAPLGFAIEHWRAEPAPRRALDVWAALAGYGTVFAVARPFMYVRSERMCGLFPRSENCFHLELGRFVRALDLTLGGVAVVVALAVLASELHLRRVIARAHAGALDGHRVTAAAATDAPSLATTGRETLRALVGPPPAAGYRDDASDAAVALVPAPARVSWRLVAMPAVVALCAAGLASDLLR